MAQTTIIPLDLNFLSRPQAIASYLIRYTDGAILVECGPMSTLTTLEKRLAEHGLGLKDVTHVLVTHIHLDHAGAAGTVRARGPAARADVHERGAPHLSRPDRLVASATQIYGDQMDRL
ncbi:MAG: MBL fold metallo-hydrolase, partial [Anaerolineales bacterium]